MKQIKYLAGFIVGLFRVSYGFLEQTALYILDMPEACHLYGLVCYHTDKLPNQVTEEEMLAAQEAHEEECE